MPIYSVQGPDGKTYSIEGPAGATREEVIGAIQARMAQQPRPVTPEPVMAPAAPAAPSTQRSFGEAGTDILAAGLGGLGGLLQFPGQVVGLLPGLRPVGEVAQKPGEAVSEFAQSLKSEGLKAREALRSKALSEAEKDGVISQFATAITSTIKDPALITTFVAEQVPLLLGPLGAVKVTQKIGAKAIESAGAGLTGAAAEQAVKEAVKTVNKRAAVAAYGTGAAMQAADVSDDTYRDAYQKALDSGLSEQEAADRAIAAARIAGTGAGVTALLAQRLPGAQAIEKRLAGVPGTKGRVASGFGEAIGESIEEGGGQVFKNIGLRQVDPNQALLEGVGGAAGLGALGGGILGTALGKRTVEQEQRFEGQREGETDRQFAARLQREIDAGLRPPAPPPAAPPAPTLPTDQQLFTLAAQPNGYGLLENLKQRILQDQQFPEADRKAAADNIANLQLKMTEEEATRAQSPKSIVTQAELSQAGIPSNDPLASIANRDFVADNQVFDTINQALSGEITDEQRKRYEGLYEGLSQLRQDFYPEGQDAGIPQMVTPPAAPTTPAPQIKSNDELFDMAAKNDYGGLEQYKQGLKAVPQTAEIKQAIADAEFVQRRMNIERAGQFSISSIFEGKDLNNQADVDAVASALYGELKKKGLTPERERQIRTALDVFVNTLPEDVQAPPMPDWAVEIPEKRRVPKAPEARAEEAFRKDLIKKIREVEASSRQLAATSKSLFGALKGRLNPKEVFDISPDRRMAPLKRKSGGVDLDYFVDSGMLDAFLPPHMRHSAAQFDSTESQEYIKDSLRQGVYITFDAKTEIEKNKNTVQDMEKLLKEFDTDEINSQLQEIADEQRAKEPVAEAVPSPAAEGEGRVAEEGIGAPPAEVKGEEKPAAPVKKSLAAIPEARFKELERRVKQAEQRADEAEKAVEEAKPEVPPEIQKKIEILKQVLRKNLNKFGLKDVELNLERGMTDEGSYDGMLIKLALDAADPLGILRHESVHALKEAGFFTDKQWATLEKMADTKWIDQYLKGQRTVYNGQEMSRYDAYMQEYGGNMAIIREEAIADAFRNFSKKRPAGLMGTLTDRMKNFFKAVKSAFNGQGFESAEDIFGKVEEGALKPTKPAEAAAERKSMRVPDGIPQRLWELHEKSRKADAEQIGEGEARGIAPGALKRNATMAARRLMQETRAFTRGDEQAANDLQVRMNTISGIREAVANQDDRMLEMYQVSAPEIYEREVGRVKFSLRTEAAGFTPERIDRLINEYGYTDGRTYGFAAFVNPKDFVTATVPSEEYARRIYDEAGELDVEKLRRETQAPFLYVDMKTNRIEGHEGRHRMAAMAAEGITSAPVVIVAREDKAKKPAQYRPLDFMYLRGQKFDEGEGAPVGVYDLNPLVYTEEKQLKRMFASPDRLRFSLRSMPTVDPAIDARVGEVIRPRRKEGFIDRVVEVFSPKTFSLFREELINRYNELAELDKRVAAQIKAAGGPQQLADERAESAALLSDQATAVAAAAMGMHNRKGGIPYYADGVVTVDTSGDNEGIVSIFAPLASTGDLKTFEHYQFWANVNRAKRFILNPGGTRYVEQLLDKDDIKRAEELRQQYLAAGIDFRDIQSRWRKYNDGLVKLMRDTGVISGRAARDFMEHGDYFPFYRQVNEEDVAGPKTFSTIAGTKPPKAAKGSENEFADFFETVVRNTQAAVTMSMKNVAAQKATAQALRINEVVRLSDNPQIKQVSADTWDVFDGDYIDTVPGATKAVAESAARARFGANVNVVESPTNPGQWNVFRPVKIGQVFASSAKDAMEEARTQHLRRPDIYVYKVLENGTPVYYRAYDLKFINAIKAMNMADLPFIGLLAAPANALRTLVTKEPGYMLVNQMRDSLSAYVTSGVKMTPIVDSARQFAASISKETPEMEALFNAGVIGGYEYAHGVKEGAAVFEREVRKKAGIKTTLEQLATPATSLWGALERGTQISDGATRAEVYKRVLAETGNRAEALWQAAEVLNFYRHGRSPIIRVLTAAIPFMNARIQGLDVLYRAGINPMLDKNATDAQRQRMKTFWTRGMTMFALSSMYWLLVHDDEEYKKQEQETRDNYWLIPGMGLKIAIPFEVGVIFKVLPERILQNAFGSDTGKDTLESLKRQLQSTLGFNFIPQAFLPLYETQTNFSFFTQRPIIGQGMEDVAARYQVSPGTSMFAQMLADKLRVETSEDSSEFTKALAKSLDLSPIKVDHVIKGYTGTIGQYAVEVFDAMYNLNADVPKPSKRFEQLPIIKRLALDPDARGQVTGFFDLKNAVDEVVRTSNLLERTAQTDDYTKYLMNNMNVLAQRDYVLALDKSMKEFREMKTMIQYSNMSADVKRDLILDIQRMENQLTTNIQEVRKLAAK